MARPAEAGVLAIDLGTSSVKTLVLDQRGEVNGRGRASYPTLHPRPDQDEQHLDDWLQAAIAATASARRFAPHLDIRAIAITGQMHGTVLFDREAEPVAPAIIWSDRRAVRDVEALAERIGPDVAERIGGALAPGFQAGTLAWLRQHRPGAWTRIARIMLPKDALVYLLTGIAATDPSDAVGTGLLDARTGHWDAGILDALGIDPDWLPPVMPSGTPIVPLKADAAEALALPAGIPVIVAGGDAPVAAVGAGVTGPDDALVVLSTGAQVIWPVSDYRPDREGRWHTWPSALPPGVDGSRWNQVGATLNAGRALTWIRDLVAPGASVSELLDRSGDVPPLADGLLFLPYLVGERCPVADPLARGAFIGLGESHGSGHLTRAAIEGVTLAIADALDIIAGDRPWPATIRLGGRGAAAPVWRQTVADVLDTSVQPSAIADLSTYGAARIAAHALDWSSLTGPMPDGDHLVTPHRERAARYRELLAIYRRTRETVVPLTHALGVISR